MPKYTKIGVIRAFTPRDRIFLHPEERRNLEDAAVAVIEGRGVTREVASRTVDLLEERARERRSAISAEWRGTSRYGFAPWYDMPDTSHIRT